MIELRLGQEDSLFSLEAGFLAEQMQLITGMYTEGYAEKTKQHVLITLKWDKKDLLSHEDEMG